MPLISAVVALVGVAGDGPPQPPSIDDYLAAVARQGTFGRTDGLFERATNFPTDELLTAIKTALREENALFRPQSSRRELYGILGKLCASRADKPCNPAVCGQVVEFLTESLNGPSTGWRHGDDSYDIIETLGGLGSIAKRSLVQIERVYADSGRPVHVRSAAARAMLRIGGIAVGVRYLRQPALDAESRRVLAFGVFRYGAEDTNGSLNTDSATRSEVRRFVWPLLAHPENDTRAIAIGLVTMTGRADFRECRGEAADEAYRDMWRATEKLALHDKRFRECLEERSDKGRAKLDRWWREGQNRPPPTRIDER